jgi:hypothetical protein
MEACSAISEGEVDDLLWVAYSPIVDIDEEVNFCSPKIDDCLAIHAGLVIQNDLVRICLRQEVKDDTEFSILLLYSLGSRSTKWGKIYDPDPEGEKVTVLLFLVHCLCGNFRMLKESLLIPLSENIMFIFVVLFKIEVGWAPLINYLLDVFVILAANVGGDLQRDGIGILTFPNVFAF